MQIIKGSVLSSVSARCSSTSVKYSKPSVTDGCRLLLVCEVALGQCKDLDKRDFTLTSAPEGYNSVHGVRRALNKHTDFEVTLLGEISSLSREGFTA